MGGLILATLSGCQKDLVAPAETKTYNIFENAGTNPYIQNLVSYLKEKGDTASFRRTFALEYGIPLWSKATVLKQGSTTSMLVPLKDCDANFITGIWIFEVKDGKIRYNVARNEQCKPYYKELEPFFRELEQSLFGIRQAGASYIRKGGTQKGVNIVLNEYCMWTKVTCGNYTTWTESCWTKYDMSVSNDSDSGGGGSGEGNYDSIGNSDSGSPDPTPEPKIDDEKLKENPCAELAWNLLMNNFTFQNLVNKFIGSNSLVNISFEVIPNLTDKNGNPCQGKISEKLGDTYIISIDSGFASHANTMEVARALLHEVIHAEINYYFDLCGQDLTRFQQCYPEMYLRWQAYGFRNVGAFQHGEMTDYYRTTMKDILKSIYPGLSESMYDAATWGGLMSTSAWNALPQSEKDSIINTIKDLRNSSNGNCSQ